jgi:hypothetical protein
MDQRIKRLKEELKYLAIMRMPFVNDDYRDTRLRRLQESVGWTRYDEIVRKHFVPAERWQHGKSERSK